MIGLDAQADLIPEVRQALGDAGEILIEALYQDLHALQNGTNFARTTMADYLPAVYLNRYDLAFARKFHICLSTVVWKLQAPDGYALACVGEELALNAIVELAKALLEEREFEAGLEAFVDSAFQDTDFELLFDPRYDGFVDTEEAAKLGMGQLNFVEWFLPFLNVPYVHPFVHEEA